MSDEPDYYHTFVDLVCSFNTEPIVVQNAGMHESTSTTEPPMANLTLSSNEYTIFNIAPEEGFSGNAGSSDPDVEFSTKTPDQDNYSLKWSDFFTKPNLVRSIENNESTSATGPPTFNVVPEEEFYANNSTSIMVVETPSDFRYWSSYQQTESYTLLEIPDYTLNSGHQLVPDYNSLSSHQLFSEQSANRNAAQVSPTGVPIEASAPSGGSLQPGTLISEAPYDDKRSLRSIVQSYPSVQHSGPGNRPIYGRLFCDNCPHLRFSSSPELYAHYIQVHPGVQKLQCWKCLRKFLFQNDLMSHFRSFHYDKKGYKCSMCPAEFSNLDDFLIHEQRIHIEQPPILCDICKKKICTPAALEYHLYLFHPQRKPS